MKSSRKYRVIILSLLAGLGIASTSGTVLAGPKFPPLAPLGDPPIPSDNKQTAAKIELGRMLFFDPRIGGDASISCANCHAPDQGWGFNEEISRGYPGTIHWRNSQTIVNSGYLSKLFWAGSVPSLEAQAPSAAKGGVAGNGENDLMEARLYLIPEYRKRFKEVFGDEIPLIANVWRAMSAFERTMNHTNTPLDNYLRGNKKALSKQQVRGKKLFEGKAGCIQCHNGALATDQKYYNVGVPYQVRWEEDGLAQITFRFELYAKGANEKLYRHTKADPGLYFRNKNKWSKGKFRTAPLRYTAYTAPYMHNGNFYTMEEVIDFYNEGGFDPDGRTTDYVQTKSPLIKKLNLSDAEKEDLLAFMEAFSGPEIKIKKPVLPKYAPLFTLAELQAAQNAK
ncbi:MAG: cytochrome-c peroxidase [Gammaproteobacteria bacterium]|nr:cytochrome-c peroxidase [Gammaproteobacteria bacterium]